MVPTIELRFLDSYGAYTIKLSFLDSCGAHHWVKVLKLVVATIELSFLDACGGTIELRF